MTPTRRGSPASISPAADPAGSGNPGPGSGASSSVTSGSGVGSGTGSPDASTFSSVGVGIGTGNSSGTGASSLGDGLDATVVSSIAKTATLLPSDNPNPPLGNSPDGSEQATAANAPVGSLNAGDDLERLLRRSSDVPSLSQAVSPRPPLRHRDHGTNVESSTSSAASGARSPRGVPSGAIALAVPSAARIISVFPDRDHASADGCASSSLHGVTETRERSRPENTKTAAAVALDGDPVRSFASFASPPGFAPPSIATARWSPAGLHAVAETPHFLAITRD